MKRVKELDDIHCLKRLYKPDAAGISWVCSCQEYLKRNVCKHAIAFSVMLGTYNLTRFLNEKRKPGRPSKAKAGDALKKA
jgi:hypothetical protein